MGDTNSPRRPQLRTLLLLHVLIAFYSLSGVCAKLGSAGEPLSTTFFIFYALMLVVLGVYALGWQQAIKRLPLSVAYANKAATLLWGIIWGALIFDEGVSPVSLVGVAVVLVGVVLYSTSSDKDEGASDAPSGEGGQ